MMKRLQTREAQLLHTHFYALVSGRKPKRLKIVLHVVAKESTGNVVGVRKYNPELARKIAAARRCIHGSVKEKTKMKWRQVLANLLAQAEQETLPAKEMK